MWVAVGLVSGAGMGESLVSGAGMGGEPSQWGMDGGRA